MPGENIFRLSGKRALLYANLSDRLLCFPGQSYVNRGNIIVRNKESLACFPAPFFLYLLGFNFLL